MDITSLRPPLPAEALRRICSELLAQDADPDLDFADKYHGLRTLIALARTAKLFHEHAVNAIWHTLPGYGFLLYAVPRDAWVEAEVQEVWSGPTRQLSLVRPLVEADFVRIRHYAPRVKRIMMPSDCFRFPSRTKRYSFAPSVLAGLASYSSDNPLLPDLRVLHVSPGCGHGEFFYRELPVLFGPKVHSFYSRYILSFGEMQNPEPPLKQSLRDMLARLHQVSPRLTYLTVDIENPYPRSIRQTVSEATCRFEHLYCLSTIVPISLQALTHLAPLPSLRVLDVRLESGITDEEQLSPLLEVPRKQFFSRLLHIHLAHQSHFSPLTAILRHVSSPSLKTIQVGVTQLRAPFQQFKDCIAVIGRRKGRKKLTTVILSIETRHSDSTDADTIDEDALSPLLNLKTLTHLSLSLNYEFALDDTACHAMAFSWRNIVVLKLGPCPSQKTSEVTLEALIHFARLCPSLQRLGICLDADTKRLPLELLMIRPGCGREQTALQVLDVGRSPIKDPLAVSGVLSDLFPNLLDVDCAWDCDDGYGQDEYDELSADDRERISAETVIYTRWNDAIYTLFPQFVLVRKQEREWVRCAATRT